MVWDPITRDHHPIPIPSFNYQLFAGAVICDVPRCKHNHCHGPFRVVFIACDEDEEDLNRNWVMVYSSSTCKWIHQRALEVNDDVDSHPPVEMRPPLLIKTSLYFALDEDEVGVLRFNLETNEFFLIDLPPPVLNEDEDLDSALMVTALDGGFGYAAVEDNRLLIWSL